MNRGLLRSLVGLIVLAGFLPGCSAYSTAELFPDEYRTVALPIFENRTFYRGIEFDLTEALIKQLEQRTPYKLAAADRADTLLTGTVQSVQKRQLSRTPVAGLPQEVEVLVVIDYSWTDLRSGEVLVTRKGFSAVGRYVPTQPVGETYEIGQHAAVERLARDIVSTLRGGW